MKKIISLIFILIFVCSVSVTLFACGEDRSYKVEFGDNDVARLTLFAFDGSTERKWGLMNLGHSWISIENISDNVLDLNDRKINCGEIVSIGTWSMLDHFGVWYNVESGYISEYNRYDGRVSITIGLSEDELHTVCEFISSHDKWNFLYNCSKFALNLYNSVATESEYIETPLIYTPAYNVKNIKKFDTYEMNKPIPATGKVGYYSNAKFVSFEWEDNYESI